LANGLVKAIISPTVSKCHNTRLFNLHQMTFSVHYDAAVSA